MESIFDYFRVHRLRRVEKLLRKYKPKLLEAWYEKQEEEIRQEYEAEFTEKDNQIYFLQKEIGNEHRNAEYWHGKHDALKEVYEGVKNNIIQKVESNAMKAGEQKEQIKNLKSDLKEKE